MSPLRCIASRTVIWLLLYFLVFSPLRILYHMHPPHFMLPSICLMLTFPITPQLVPIVLQVLIWLVIIFKSLVFTHVPQFEYCLLPALSYLLNFPVLSSSRSPTRLSSLLSLKSENPLVQGTTFVGWSRSSPVALSLLVLVLSIGSQSRDRAWCALMVFPSLWFSS